MLIHPAMLSDLAHHHVADLVEEASRHRMATALRRGTRQLWPDRIHHRAATNTATATATATATNAAATNKAQVTTPASGATAGRLAACEVVPEAAGLVR